MWYRLQRLIHQAQWLGAKLVPEGWGHTRTFSLPIFVLLIIFSAIVASLALRQNATTPVSGAVVTKVQDTFTDADNTFIENHSPEIGDPSSWQPLTAGRTDIISNQLTNQGGAPTSYATTPPWPPTTWRCRSS